MTVETIITGPDGTRYSASVARIKSTQLGTEDHGIFTAYIELEWDSSGVMLGGYRYDRYDDGDMIRADNGFGIEQIAAIMQIAGARNWQNVRGSTVYILFAEESQGWGRAAGIARLSDGRVLDFDKHSKDWRSRNQEVAPA